MSWVYCMNTSYCSSSSCCCCCLCYHPFKYYSSLNQGVDLTKSTTAVLASQAAPEALGSSTDLTTLVTSLPSQGALRPGEKRVIHFRFSPRFCQSTQGWSESAQPPPRRDYALFMHIEMVGCISAASDKAKRAAGAAG